MHYILIKEVLIYQVNNDIIQSIYHNLVNLSIYKIKEKCCQIYKMTCGFHYIIDDIRLIYIKKVIHRYNYTIFCDYHLCYSCRHIITNQLYYKITVYIGGQLRSPKYKQWLSCCNLIFDI